MSKIPRRNQRARIPIPAHIRQIIRSTRPRTSGHLDDLTLLHTRDDKGRIAQQIQHSPNLRRPQIILTTRRPQHQAAVGTWHQIDRAIMNKAANDRRYQREVAIRHPQPHNIAPDRPQVQAVDQLTSAKTTAHNGLRIEVITGSTPGLKSSATTLESINQRGTETTRINLMITGDRNCGRHGGGDSGLSFTQRTRTELMYLLPTPALKISKLGDVRAIGIVAGNDVGSLTTKPRRHVGRFDNRRNQLRVQAHRSAHERQQRLLAVHHFRSRSEHTGRVVRCAGEWIGVDNSDAAACTGKFPCGGKPHQSGSNNGCARTGGWAHFYSSIGSGRTTLICAAAVVARSRAASQFSAVETATAMRRRT